MQKASNNPNAMRLKAPKRLAYNLKNTKGDEILKKIFREDFNEDFDRDFKVFGKEFEAPGKVRQRSLREFKENSLATCERRNWNLALNREKFKNKILIY